MCQRLLSDFSWLLHACQELGLEKVKKKEKRGLNP